MATEVKNGPKPKFRAPLQRGGPHYGIELAGYYTRVDGLTAAGVTRVRWNSKRAVKRQAELLGMRSAFVGWFLETYLENGGTWRNGVRALKHYPFHRVRARLNKHQKKAVRKWHRPSRRYERLLFNYREWMEGSLIPGWWRR